MRTTRSLLLCLALAVAALSQCGCTMFIFCDGGGPLTYHELGDWLGMEPLPAPEPQQLAALVADLKQVQHAGFSGRYSLPGDASVFSMNFIQIFSVPFTPAPGLIVKGRYNPWKAFVPGSQHGDWLYFDPAKPGKRQFYAAQNGSDCILAWWDRADAYDVATRQRVASRRTSDVIGLGLGWTRYREVAPLDEDEQPGVQALASPAADPTKARYLVRDGNILLLGIVGWGRVNHTRYIQVLWIPIPVGKAGA